MIIKKAFLLIELRKDPRVFLGSKFELSYSKEQLMLLKRKVRLKSFKIPF